MRPASAYIIVWLTAGFSGLALLVITRQLFRSFRKRRESPTSFRFSLALVGYPLAILYLAVDQIRAAVSAPGSFTMMQLLFPAGALALCVVLGLAEWRYISSGAER